MFKKIGYAGLFTMFLFTLSGCGQWNIFKWAHKEGGSTDTTVLVADGQALLDEGNYTKAVEVFEKAMTSNPKSSEANYGYARAVISASGLGLADLISSIVKSAQSGGPGTAPTGSPYAAFFTNGGSQLEDLLPKTLDLHKLYLVSRDAVPALKRIADLETDNIIPADDVDVNFNLAFLLVVRGACSVLDTDGDGYPGDYDVGTSSDIVKVKSNFTVTLPTKGELDNYSTKGKLETLKNQISLALNDAVSAIHYLGVALKKIQPEAAQKLEDNTGTLKQKIQELKDYVNDQSKWQ